MKRRQITCKCRAYGFPHRFGGGSCTGIEIVIEKAGSDLCRFCMLNNNGCEVIKGMESPDECGYVIEFKQYNEV